MGYEAAEGRSWRSDTLLLGTLAAVPYWAAYWAAGLQVPHLGTYLCGVGALLSFVPAPRELTSRRYRVAAMIGGLLSGVVLWHIVTTGCTGLCK